MSAWSVSDLPNLFLIGAQKSGTTALAHALASHPEIAACHSKEPNILGCRSEDSRIALYSGSWNTPGARFRLDASPYYFHSEQSMRRISDLVGESARVVLILRDPSSRALSAFWFTKANGMDDRSAEEVFTPALAVAPEFEAMRAWEAQSVQHAFTAGRLKLGEYSHRFPNEFWTHQYLGNSMYSHWMEMLFKYIDPAKVHIVLADGFREKPGSIISGVFEFLGIDSSPARQTAEIEKNTTYVPVDGIVSRGLRSLSRTVPVTLRSPIRKVLGGAYDKLTKKKPDHSQALIGALRRHLAPEVDRLRSTLPMAIPASWFG